MRIDQTMWSLAQGGFGCCRRRSPSRAACSNRHRALEAYRFDSGALAREAPPCSMTLGSHLPAVGLRAGGWPTIGGDYGGVLVGAGLQRCLTVDARQPGRPSESEWKLWHGHLHGRLSSCCLRAGLPSSLGSPVFAWWVIPAGTRLRCCQRPMPCSITAFGSAFLYLASSWL